nr:hypothetical protein [Tanacetum cinerariifolium]
MGDKHLSTIPKTKSDDVIKSSVKNLVQILSEYEVTSVNESECDMPVCEDSSTFDVLKDHSEILSDSNNDDTSSDDDAFKDIDINRLIADIEFLNHNPTPDRELKSSSSFPIFAKSDNSLFLDNSLPKFEAFSDHTKETRSDSTTALANNSPPEYDSFYFEIKPDKGRLTSVVMNDIFDNSTNDPFLEAVDLFLVSDNSIPPGIGNIDYDSEGDIHFLKELLSNYSISVPENKSSNFDHHDDPSFPRPPSELPDVEFFFNFEPNSGELISAIMNNINELNEDECFDPGGGEIDVFANIEDNDYFPLIFIIRIFLPYLTNPEVLLLAWDRVFKIKDALRNKQYKPEDTQELFRELFNDVQKIHEELAEYINTSGWNRPAFYNNGDDDDEDCTIAVTPDFLITDSLIIGDEHLNTILEKESDELNKSSVEDLVPNPSEFEDECECDMPDCDDSQTINFSTFSNPLFDDSTSSDDE